MATRYKPKNEFGLKLDTFRSRTGMTLKELAQRADVKYSTMIECTTGRCVGEELKPKVEAVIEQYYRENNIPDA